MTTCRKIKRKFLCDEVPEGKKSIVRAPIGSPHLRQLDPFLMLEDAEHKQGAGFPDHSHRGFEAVTYILDGTLKHEDSNGHVGMLNAGDLQWLTAGRGISHASCSPGREGSRELQLWINLKRKDKMCEPFYQEISSESIPKPNKDGVTVAVLAGESLGVKSQVRIQTPSLYLDFTLLPGSKHTQSIPPGWSCFAYTLGGITHLSGEEVSPHYTVLFEDGDVVVMENKSNASSRLLLLAGEPINEPIVVEGNYVMNTQEEIQATIHDVTSGTNGFEKAPTWRSSINRIS